MTREERTRLNDLRALQHELDLRTKATAAVEKALQSLRVEHEEAAMEASQLRRRVAAVERERDDVRDELRVVKSRLGLPVPALSLMAAPTLMPVAVTGASRGNRGGGAADGRGLGCGWGVRSQCFSARARGGALWGHPDTPPAEPYDGWVMGRGACGYMG
jgi:hypothetical protein